MSGTTEYAVVTVYEPPAGMRVIHTWGPMTRSRAQTVRRKTLRAHEHDHRAQWLKVSVTRLLPDVGDDA